MKAGFEKIVFVLLVGFMGDRPGRLGAKRKAEKTVTIQGALKKTKTAIIESLGEEDVELSSDIRDKASIMAENAEAIRDVGRIVAETLARQAELQREREEAIMLRQREREEENLVRQREREEANIEKFKELIEGQQKFHREDAEQLTQHFERLRIDKENARGQQKQTLPKYDGISIEVDEWVERVEAVMTGNFWDISKLLEAMPGSLVGQAKRAFDTLTDDEKITKDSLLKNMRAKIDPQAETRNKDLFSSARRGKNESNHTFIDRLKMYIRRSGEDPKDSWAQESMKGKVYESLAPTARMIVNGAVNRKDPLEKIVAKADDILTDQVSVIGSVTDTMAHPMQTPTPGIMRQGTGPQYNSQVMQLTEPYEIRGNCWTCNTPGHKSINCPSKTGPSYFMGNFGAPQYTTQPMGAYPSPPTAIRGARGGNQQRGIAGNTRPYNFSFDTQRPPPQIINTQGPRPPLLPSQRPPLQDITNRPNLMGKNNQTGNREGENQNPVASNQPPLN